VSAINDFDRNNVKAAGRGALHGVNSVSTELVGAARDLSQMTNLYKIGRTPDEQVAFLEADAHPETNNPFEIPEQTIDKYLGAPQGQAPWQDHVQKLLEKSSEFATNWEIVGAALKGNALAPFLGKVGADVAEHAQALHREGSIFAPLAKLLSSLGAVGAAHVPALRAYLAAKAMSGNPDAQQASAAAEKQVEQGLQQIDDLHNAVRVKQN
jgi:hypothetical protein